MKHNTLSLAMVAMALATLWSCSASHGVQVVSRQRLLIDQRWDSLAAADTAAQLFMAPYAHVVDSLMSPVVGTTAMPLAASRPESPLSNLLADILVWASEQYGEHPDLGVYNMGGIRASLPQGTITFGDVLEVAPFENKICFLTLSGEALTQLFVQMASVGGEGVSHGVELTISPKGALIEARLHGQPIDPNGQYRIATIDYLAEGNDRLEAFKLKKYLNAPREASNDTRYIIADYFRHMARQGLPVAAKVEGRVTITHNEQGGQPQ